METPDQGQQQAQHRVDQIRQFQTEAQALVREGVIQADEPLLKDVFDHQQTLMADLARRYELNLSETAHQLGWGMKISAWFGALAFSASLYFLFYRFWGEVSTPVQLALLTTLPLVLVVVTEWLANQPSRLYFAKITGLLALAAFVLNLSMFGQIFSITPKDGAFLAWGALAMFLAYRLHSGWLLLTALLCAMGFLSARIGSWSGVYWMSFSSYPENFFIPAILCFCLPDWISQQQHTKFPAIYRVTGLFFLLMPILVLSNWGQGSYLIADPDTIENVYQLLGFLISVLAIRYGIRNNHRHVVNAGVGFFLLFLVTKFFDWWWEWMPKYVFFLLLGMIALMVLVVARRLHKAQGVKI